METEDPSVPVAEGAGQNIVAEMHREERGVRDHLAALGETEPDEVRRIEEMDVRDDRKSGVRAPPEEPRPGAERRVPEEDHASLEPVIEVWLDAEREIARVVLALPGANRRPAPCQNQRGRGADGAHVGKPAPT